MFDKRWLNLAPPGEDGSEIDFEEAERRNGDTVVQKKFFRKTARGKVVKGLHFSPSFLSSNLQHMLSFTGTISTNGCCLWIRTMY